MLELEHIHLDFPDKPNVLADINLQADGGEIVGLVAPNGMGKTTLLKVILNRLHPSNGAVRIQEQGYTSQAQTRKNHALICAFPEQSDLYGDLSGRAHMQFYADCWQNKTKSIAEIITTLNMDSYVDRPTRTYSLGMKQRLCFAMVMAANTPVMLLDEVMNGLDPLNVAMISEQLRRLRAEGKLVLIVSHLLNNLQTYVDRTIFLKDGHFVLDIDAHTVPAQYLKFSGDPAQVSGATAYTETMNTLPLAGLDGARVGALASQLFTAGVAFTVGPLTLEEQFSHFYAQADEHV
nr:ABC transporter ATP-binding protein [Lacticaseibacillus absianus]